MRSLSFKGANGDANVDDIFRNEGGVVVANQLTIESVSVDDVSSSGLFHSTTLLSAQTTNVVFSTQQISYKRDLKGNV